MNYLFIISIWTISYNEQVGETQPPDDIKNWRFNSLSAFPVHVEDESIMFQP